jgi:3-oxoacyl-[acyl-carrier-protein] synthase II
MIAITGIGVISSLGMGKESLVSGFLEKRSGLSKSGERFFGECKDFSVKKYLPSLKARKMSRFSQLSLCSAIEAVEDSGISINNYNKFRIGIFVGTGLSSTESTNSFYDGLMKDGPLGCNPILFPETVQNIAASHISIYFGIKGPNVTFSQDNISSELALFYAIELLNSNTIDAAIVSGADELNNACIAGFSAMNALSKNSAVGMMPFDKRRNGIVLGEGGATIVLERLEDAKKREAKIYSEILSSSFTSCPAERTEFDKSAYSMKKAMSETIAKANIKNVDVIFASANSTVDLDKAETTAIKEVLGKDAYKIPVSASRSYTGVFFGDGILRIAGSALCIKEGLIPKTLGLEMPSEECDLDYVVDGPRRAAINYAMINSFSNGGSAVSIILKRP